MATILVIDDDDAVRSMMCELLELQGYDVLAAANGRVALKMLKGRSADLVITDLFMPEMEGIETIMALRASWPGVPIIAMSGGYGWDTTQSLKTAHYLGAVKTLPKPAAVADIIRAVQTALVERA